MFGCSAHPGSPPIQNVVRACRPWLGGQPDPRVAYVPAASVSHRWIGETSTAYRGLAQVDVVDVEGEARPAVASALDRATVLGGGCPT